MYTISPSTSLILSTSTTVEPAFSGAFVVEPGVYVEGKYGIRIENEIIVEKDYDNEYGTWLKFATLTLVPVELDAVNVSLLQDEERNALNSYHSMVRDKLSPYFIGEELAWLNEATRNI